MYLQLTLYSFVRCWLLFFVRFVRFVVYRCILHLAAPSFSLICPYVCPFVLKQKRVQFCVAVWTNTVASTVAQYVPPSGSNGIHPYRYVFFCISIPCIRRPFADTGMHALPVRALLYRRKAYSSFNSVVLYRPFRITGHLPSSAERPIYQIWKFLLVYTHVGFRSSTRFVSDTFLLGTKVSTTGQ